MQALEAQRLSAVTLHKRCYVTHVGMAFYAHVLCLQVLLFPGTLCVGHDCLQDLLMNIINNAKFVAKSGDQQFSCLLGRNSNSLQ